MTTTTIRVLAPRTVEAPRGALWAASAGHALVGVVRSAWRFAEAIGRRRAARDLREQAIRCQSYSPERARLLLAASAELSGRGANGSRGTK